ncbi:MAG: phosphatidylglycerophosphatase A family protein [Elusimicrobiota bacterium]
MSWLNDFIATGFGIGEKTPAPGTVATILAAAIIFFITSILGIKGFIVSSIYWVVLIALTFIGIVTAGNYEKNSKVIDPPQVVIDEILGFFIAVAFLPPVDPGSEIYLTPGRIITALIIFRIIDITKVYPMDKLEIVAGGLGIMLDDIYAGILTNVIIRVALLLL